MQDQWTVHKLLSIHALMMCPSITPSPHATSWSIHWTQITQRWVTQSFWINVTCRWCNITRDNNKTIPRARRPFKVSYMLTASSTSRKNRLSASVVSIKQLNCINYLHHAKHNCYRTNYEQCGMKTSHHQPQGLGASDGCVPTIFHTLHHSREWRKPARYM